MMPSGVAAEIYAEARVICAGDKCEFSKQKRKELLS